MDLFYKYISKLLSYISNMNIGDWGLGIGDWAQSPIPNPQSPSILSNIKQYSFFLY